jgi:hypothetical protein
MLKKEKYKNILLKKMLTARAFYAIGACVQA